MFESCRTPLLSQSRKRILLFPQLLDQTMLIVLFRSIVLLHVRSLVPPRRGPVFFALFLTLFGQKWNFGTEWGDRTLRAKLPILLVQSFCLQTSFCLFWTGFKRGRQFDWGPLFPGVRGEGCWRSPSLGSQCGRESLLGGAGMGYGLVGVREAPVPWQKHVMLHPFWGILGIAFRNGEGDLRTVLKFSN